MSSINSMNNEDTAFRAGQSAEEDVNAARCEKSQPRKKHPCPDCTFCQWCGDDRCVLCLRKGDCCRKKLSMAEQIALYEEVNRKDADRKQ